MELSAALDFQKWGGVHRNMSKDMLISMFSPAAWIFLILVYVITTFLFRKLCSISKSSSSDLPLPPGPRCWPILGSMFHISKLPHQYFAQQAKKYGSPIVHARLGYSPWIVVHSPEIAMEVLKTRDMEFAYRTPSVFAEHFSFGYQDLIFRNHTDATWRHLRKVCATSLFTTSSLRLSAAWRQEEISAMVSTIRSDAIKSGSTFVLKARPLIYENNMNMMSRMLFGKKYFGKAHSLGREAATFRTIQEQLAAESAKIHLGDLFPMLRGFDLLGTEKNLRERVRPAMENFFAAIIAERKLQHHLDGGIKKHADFLDVLLSLKDGDTVSDICIMALLSDLMAGGSDTGTISLEWALSELIAHPDQLMKAQQEIDNVVGQNRLVQESDLPYLPYVHAIIKETMRRHPPIPLLLPHYTPVASHLGGYKVPAGSTVMVNAWAIGRDPNVWSNPEEFNPDRFLGVTDTQFVGGKQFQLVPFSAGRRQCPGYPLAAIQLPLTLGSLIHAFNWGPPAGQKPEDLDMNETFGLSCHRAVPLQAAVSYRLKLHVL
ncbi:hypothetical protein O6H91_13G045100 [Diphasiastrum complanatum]|uniref:Uncharacterized protein n=1 Tax=Diphasiastrum complanatum TaxID=34168 RepID=A0ACC2BVD9_DIPCM|nr:hypothetical protein O6H91_13G045100 [Diphasiastrum complanatum]